MRPNGYTFSSVASRARLALLAPVSALLVAQAACRSTPGLRAAESGDRAALASAVAPHQRRGDLSEAQAQALARAVAGREVRAACGAEAMERIRDAWACAHELDDALADRMRIHDDAGAQAVLARVDGRALDADDLRRYLGDADPAWRAVGVRGLVRTEDRAARVFAFTDPNPLVRRAAARAAHDATDPNDLDALAEAARVDPEPLVRTEAVRAIAVLPAQPDEGAVHVLRDLWVKADAGLREDIALAWAGPALWGAGGREALLVVVASEHGAGAIEAAAAVLRHDDVQPDLASSAAAQLERAIAQGASAARMQAIAQAPLEQPGIVEALQRVAADGELDLRVAALSRLAQRKANEAAAQPALEALAQPGSRVAARARFALASLGDRRVQGWIEQDLSAEAPSARLSAAADLAALGVPSRAVPLLADADAGVRVRAACTILMAARAR
jgi:hypothetical protein